MIGPKTADLDAPTFANSANAGGAIRLSTPPFTPPVRQGRKLGGFRAAPALAAAVWDQPRAANRVIRYAARPRPERGPAPAWGMGRRRSADCRKAMLLAEPGPIYTIGHSTLPRDEFIAVLQSYGIGLLVDIRTVPRSRTNPQYNLDALPAALAADRSFVFTPSQHR